MRLLAGACSLLLGGAGGCDEAPSEPEVAAGVTPAVLPGDPSTARRDLLELLREGADADRHPADGSGKAWLEGEEPFTATVATPGRWTIVYEAGPEGVQEGGVVFLLVSPYWYWSNPQVRSPDGPGYTTASTTAPGVTLDTFAPSQHLFAAAIQGRDLKPGERIRVVYGDGAVGARADRYAEKEAPLWVAVDGDGDGTYGILADSPTLQVRPGPCTQLQVTAPSTARPGQEVSLHVALLDVFANMGCTFEGTVRVSVDAEGLSLPEPVSIGDSARVRIPITVEEEGTFRFQVTARSMVGEDADEITAQANPLEVGARVPRVLWGDLHGHSNLSDGTGTPEDYFVYAREVAGLDVVALTDHDHWGVLKLDAHPELWERIEGATEAAHEPGNFVTLLGYEWTSWIHGHRHVLHFADEGPMLSSVDPRYETPAQLWEALRGLPALTFAHHSAGGPIANNWAYLPDPVLEPVTEIMSVHGSSEAADSPQRIYSPVAGNFVRDILDRGVQVGFIGSGDSHDGHPGLVQLGSPPNGGLAAILSEDRTREGVLEAMRSRRVYATSGPRILLRAALDGHRMGEDVPPSKPDAVSLLYVRVVGTGPL
ncbi:MAG: DUF3604 domain-containing protein, partial [Myxococcota bacterium]|nr:DUF3604 domain-containing protein [Myxococcota bacterium]